MSVRVLEGDCRELLPTLPDASVHCVITSPPYWLLRDYQTGTWQGGDAACAHVAHARPKGQSSVRNGGFIADRPAGRVCSRCGAVREDRQIGLEETLAAYLETLVGVFREVRRVLRPDGTCWLNIGDAYANDLKWGGKSGQANTTSARGGYQGQRVRRATGYKPKDLMLIPHRLAIALQDDGWYVRQDCIWNKTNPMPESVQDRPTTSHEHVFMLTRAPRYYYDAEAVRQPVTGTARGRYAAGQVQVTKTPAGWNTGPGGHATIAGRYPRDRKNPAYTPEQAASDTRNLRSVWTVATQPFPEAHFATFPERLVEPAILAGTSAKGACPACGAPWRRVVEKVRTIDGAPAQLGAWRDENIAVVSTAQGVGHWRIGSQVRTVGWKPGCRCNVGDPVPCTVLDPFGGSGTTARVATRHGRDAILIELNPQYIGLADERTAGVQMSLESVV
jgi:DNA modification methylase